MLYLRQLRSLVFIFFTHILFYIYHSTISTISTGSFKNKSQVYPLSIWFGFLKWSSRTVEALLYRYGPACFILAVWFIWTDIDLNRLSRSLQACVVQLKYVFTILSFVSEVDMADCHTNFVLVALALGAVFWLWTKKQNNIKARNNDQRIMVP